MKIGYCTNKLLNRVTEMFPDRKLDDIIEMTFGLGPTWTPTDVTNLDILFFDAYEIPETILVSLLFEAKKITESVVLMSHDANLSASWNVVGRGGGDSSDEYVQLLKDQGFFSVRQVRDYIVAYTT